MFSSSQFQLRKYKGSERIKQKAEVIYHKLKAFFLSGEGDFGTPTTPVVSQIGGKKYILNSILIGMFLIIFWSKMKI